MIKIKIFGGNYLYESDINNHSIKNKITQEIRKSWLIPMNKDFKKYDFKEVEDEVIKN